MSTCLTVQHKQFRYQCSTVSLVPNIPRLLSLWLLICTLIAGCGNWSNDTVKIRIVFTDNNPTHQLTNVSIVVGSDKYFWRTIAAGKVETVTLRPSATDDRQMTLLYTLEGQQKSWDGPKFDVGTGYRIEIKIDAHSFITHRHCILPCSI